MHCSIIITTLFGMSFLPGWAVRLFSLQRPIKQYWIKALKSTLSEVCLPVKVYFGHAAYLARRVDYLFVPRITRVEAKGIYLPQVYGYPGYAEGAYQ